MRFAIAYHKNNIAGNNIVEQFKQLAFAPQIPIISLEKETIFSDDITINNFPVLKEIDLLVFASTHKSEKGNPSLCLHAPGNFRNAELGGKPGKISKTSAFVLKYLFKQLNKNAKLDKEISDKYNVTLEVTHHGPSIDIPCVFIEVGSNEKDWNDLNACKVVAKTILSLQDYNKQDNKNYIPCIGIGGPHYAPVFNQIQLNSEFAISHIIAQYNLPITENMIKQAELKTSEQIKFALIDWKGCGKSEDRQKVLDVLEKLGLEYKRTSEVEK
jgi:D-aminoacyl-tRNA deacylase